MEIIAIANNIKNKNSTDNNGSLKLKEKLFFKNIKSKKYINRV
jgi:hypothetical protein